MILLRRRFMQNFCEQSTVTIGGARCGRLKDCLHFTDENLGAQKG